MTYIMSNTVDPGLIFRWVLIIAIFAAYLWLAIIDFKYKEMWFLQEFSIGFLNITAIIIYSMISGKKTFILPAVIAMIVWFAIVFINGMFNNDEGKDGAPPKIGAADIDLFSLQFLISAAIVIWTLIFVEAPLNTFLAMEIVNRIFTSLLIGLIFIAVVWVGVVIFKYIFKNKEKNNLRIIFKENREVPTIVAVIPLVLLNLIIIMKM